MIAGVAGAAVAVVAGVDSVPRRRRTADAVKECDPEDSATAIVKECDWRSFLVQADAD